MSTWKSPPKAKIYEALSAVADGRVVRMTTDGQNVTELVKTGGRPLGTRYDANGRLLICDADKGLLALGADGKLETLADASGDPKVYVADGLAITKDGVVYFSDASARFPIEKYVDDIFEHRGSGRLLKWDPATKQTTLVASNFTFANGVALRSSRRVARRRCDAREHRRQRRDRHGIGERRTQIKIAGHALLV